MRRKGQKERAMGFVEGEAKLLVRVSSFGLDVSDDTALGDEVVVKVPAQTIVAKVDSLSGPGSWSKTGLNRAYVRDVKIESKVEVR